MVGEMDMSKCLQLHERELVTHRLTCSNAALGGGGGMGARGGGGGGGGGTGMMTLQLPADTSTVSSAPNKTRSKVHE